MNSSAETISATPIEKRGGVSYAEFQRDYMKANRPIVLTDALKDWRALGKWSPQFFADRFPDKEFTLDGKQWRLADHIAAVLASDPANPAPYLRNEVLKEKFPELWDDIDPKMQYAQPNWMERPFRNKFFNDLFHRGSAIELYIGGNGRGFPVLHWDGYHTHAFLMQFYGRKEFYVYGPEQTQFLYPSKDSPNISQCADIKNVDLEKYPLFAKAAPSVFVLEPGETLFIPSGWWHTTMMLSPSISLSCNVGNSTNWKAMRSDFTRRGNLADRAKAALYLLSKGWLCGWQDFLG